MNRDLGEQRLTAHWAVLGKHPGRTMGYEVLRGSLPGDRAGGYLWKAAATGAPGGRDPDGALPWRVFLGATDTRPEPVCAVVETTWDGATDGTGAPSYTWRLTLLDWAEAGRSALTWTALDRALTAKPPEQPADDTPTTVSVPPVTPTELALHIDELGFDWAAGVAALLLDGRRVAITPAQGRALPDVTERVRALDAVAALLPYGCRVWIGAATWTGQAQHDLRLFFAPAAGAGESAAVLGGGPPHEPRDEGARRYLRGLRRLRAKTGDTAAIVADLLTATEPVAAPSPSAALRVLREADLLDMVVDEIRAGGGAVGDVRRVLARHPAATLDEGRLGVLLPYLVRTAGRGERLAGELLAEHWSARTRTVLVRDVLDTEDPARSFEGAKRSLGAVHETVEAHRTGSFDELFHALIAAPETTPDWTGTLIYMAENEWGRSTAAADRLLVHDRAVGKTWLECLLKHKRRSLGPLGRLARRARQDMPADATPGWLRFASVLLGEDRAAATSTDAADFAEAVEGGWLSTLDIARVEGRPEVLALMWPRLWRLARTERELGRAVDRLVPVAEPQRSGAIAADADLFGVAAGTGGPGMPRLARLADEGELRSYAKALLDRIESDGELRRLAVEALLSGEPGPGAWRVVELLSLELPDSFLHQLCDEVHARLTGRGRPLNDLDVPARLMAQVAKRYDLAWLRPVHEFRKAAQEAAHYEDLARIVVDAGGPGRMPAQLVDAVARWAADEGPYSLAQVTEFMDGMADGLPGLRLYGALVDGDRHPALREQLTRYSEDQRARHEAIVRELRRGPGPSATAPAAETERRGVLGKVGRRRPGRRR